MSSPQRTSSVQTKKRKKREDGVEEDMASQGKRRMNRMSLPSGMETKKRLKIMEGHVGQYLRGVCDDVVLQVMTPKLPWREVHVLSSACPSFQQAIKSREVYNARVRLHSTETLAVVRHHRPGHDSGMSGLKANDYHHLLSLYSMTNKYWFDLPPIPFRGGVRRSCHHVSLDGKLYVLGGAKHPRPVRHYGSKRVYMLDVAGQGQWKRCANMLEGRVNFGASVLDGKIFVFGGCSFDKPVFGCDVYDPKTDAWSPIVPPDGDIRVNHKITTVEEELIVYGGQYLGDHTKMLDDPEHPRDHPIYSPIDDALVLDVYHPVKGEWRQIEPFEEEDELKENSNTLFMAQGKLHRMNLSSIDVYDVEKDTWSLLHSFLLAPKGFNACGFVGDTLALGDELLYKNGMCLYQSKGFGSSRDEIEWEKAKSSLSFDTSPYFMCPIEL